MGSCPADTRLICRLRIAAWDDDLHEIQNDGSLEHCPCRCAEPYHWTERGGLIKACHAKPNSNHHHSYHTTLSRLHIASACPTHVYPPHHTNPRLAELATCRVRALPALEVFRPIRPASSFRCGNDHDSLRERIGRHESLYSTDALGLDCTNE
jgi:hypothetical protein